MLNRIDFKTLIPGTLSKVSNQYGEFFHLTWKENQKTITRYIRIDEVKKVRTGIRAYQKVKILIDNIAKKNLRSLLKSRKYK